MVFAFSEDDLSAGVRGGGVYVCLVSAQFPECFVGSRFFWNLVQVNHTLLEHSQLVIYINMKSLLPLF